MPRLPSTQPAPPAPPLYKFDDYKSFLSQMLTYSGPNRGRRAQLARFLGCQPAYISQVLNGAAHLSLEQAHKVAKFLELDRHETAFLLLLLQHERAGTVELKRFFREEIETVRKARTEVRERLRLSAELTGEERMVYYSSWHYAAIHVTTSIPRYQTPDAIAKRLHVPRQLVLRCLQFLTKAQLVVERDGRYEIGPRRIHLGRDSPLITRHHSNWRLQSLIAMDQPQAKALHYSSVVSLAKADVEKIKDLLLDALSQSEEILSASKEEEVYCLCLDLFELGTGD